MKNLFKTICLVSVFLLAGNMLYAQSEQKVFLGLGCGLDVLEPGYYFEYKFIPGTYSVKVTDSKNKSYESKSFKVVTNKLTILLYDGTAVDVIAAGVDYFDLSKSSTNITFQSVQTMVKMKKSLN